MWLLQNATPFEAERTWIRDAEGAEVWLVAIKATFEIDPEGRQFVAEVQEPISRVPLFAGDPAETGLVEETDFVLRKARTDVLLKGHAYAPEGRPAERVPVRIKVASIDKTLNVFGERSLSEDTAGPMPGRPQPFEKMEIVYERSFGGTDRSSEDPAEHAWEPTNPVGVGFGLRKDHVARGPAPNIEYPDAPYRDHRRGRAAGFGPVARHWSPRRELAGTYDAAWEKTRFPLPPTDFDDAFYQCAPPDQQSDGLLLGYERVQLGNLTPEGYLDFVLPRVTFRIVTQFYRAPDRTHEAVLHTVRLLPDERRFQMVWHSGLPCPYDEARLKETTVALRQRSGVSEATRRSGAWIPG